MKALLYLLIVACTTILWNSNVLSQSLPPISKSSVNTSAECDPPNHWMGFFDPSVASSPNPIIFSEQIKEELMSDGFQGKDKEYGDIDNDGDVDILYTKNNKQLWLLRNSGNPTNPEFLLNHAVNTGLIGVYSFKFLDWFADSIQDLLVLEQFNSDPPIVSLYININSQIGFPAPAAVLINGTTVPLNSNNFIEVGTINDDPYPDILISGTVGIHGTALFTSSFNSGWNLPVAPPFRIEPPQTFATPMIPDNSGSAPCPELFDADCDGDLDLFISDPIWAGGGGHVDFYRLIDKASPQLSYTHINPNPYGFDDILSPNTALTCDWVITRFADFFGDGKAEAIAYNPCSTNHPKGDMIYYKNTFQCDADFSFSSIDGCQVFQFTDLSSSTNAITYSWNFGDPQSGNNTSVVQNPNHYFTACGTYTVCLTISGYACNLTVCHVVPVLDIIPPIASCLSGTGIVLDANCIAVTSPTIFDNGSTDNCQIYSMSISQDTFTQCGNFPIILTVSDWCGNTAACVSNVQVVESIPPIIRCHPNLTISSTSNSCTKVVNGIKWTILSDNCSSPTVTYTVTGATTHAGVNDASGISFNTGISTVTYKATDACGNSSTCSFDVRVICACNCPNNLLLNPGFYQGAIAGSFMHGAHSDHWSDGSYTPQVVANDSCCDNYSIQMWGYELNGESIVQQGLSFTSGHHYKISFCGRYLPITNAGSVNFGFTAADSIIDPYKCTNCDDIGSSPKITSPTWNTYTLPIWTPTQNWDRIYIRAFNLYSLKAWGRIDNICVTEVNQACCTDEAAFIENAHNAVRLYASADGHEGIFDIGHLPACDSITFIDWGDGHVTQGPFGGDTRQKNYFINNIKTRVQYQVIEYNRDVDPAVPCFQHTFSDSLVVPRPGACACTAFSEIFIRGSEGEFSTVLGDDQVLQLHCLNPGSSYTVTGSFNCKGSGCASQTPVIWTITGPSGTFNGITYADNYFGITLLPAMMSDPGSYVLTLEGHCGGSVCNEIIPFNVQCPDNCPCTAQEISAFHDGVERGFAIVFRPDLGCIVQFAPLALNNCETVTWYLNNTLGTPIGESVGKESFAYTFSDAATYNVVMEVTKKKNDGSTCDKQMRLQQVTVTCQHAPDCVNSVIDNPGFSEGAVAGGLNSGGRSLGWNDLEGEPTVVEGLEGSLDGWTISLSGNHDTADVLSRFEPICLGKGTGLLTTTVKSAKFRGSERIFGGTLKIYLGRSLSFPPVGFSLDECNGINCFELATISLPVTDSAEWFEIQIPYDLSRWAAIDDCSGFSAVLVRPAIFVTNVLGSDQGGSSSYSSVQIDNFCFNEILVGVNNPPAKQTFRIYPNPNSGEFTVELKELSSQDLSLRIINLAGKNVMQKKFEEGKVVQNINAGQLSPGMYFLQIISEGRVISVNKIVIQ